jgi:uncharacterized metal-binding protein YceD (DUF177 family)
MTSEIEATLRLDATKNKPRTMRFEGDAALLAVIASRLGLERVDAFAFDASLEALGPGDIFRAQGTITMLAERICVTTLEPFIATTETVFEELFTTSPHKVSDLDAETLDPDVPDILLLEEDHVDFGDLVLQYTAMALDPYPRSPEARAAGETVNEEPLEPEAETRRPFAGLDKLLEKRGGKA